MYNYENLIVKKDECSICFNQIKKKIILDCNHYYCNNCISEWVKRSNYCPMCRKKINFQLVPELIPIVNSRRQLIYQEENMPEYYLKFKRLIFFIFLLFFVYLLFELTKNMILKKRISDNNNLNVNENNNHY